MQPVVTNESDLSIAYSIRPEHRSGIANSIIPFQCQIRYTKPDGSRCIRILSKSMTVTTSRADAEAACNAAIVGVATIQRAAALAQDERDFSSARNLIHAARHMLRRGAQTDEQQEEMGNFIAQSEEVDTELRSLESRSSSSLSDQSAKVFGSKKKANRNQFLAASKKTVVSQRKGDARLNAAYYAYQFE
jgi:hypothetical protein